MQSNKAKIVSVHETPLTIGGLSDLVARSGRSAPPSTIRNLERRGIIKARRNSARTRLFDADAAEQVIAYLDKRDAAASA